MRKQDLSASQERDDRPSVAPKSANMDHFIRAEIVHDPHVPLGMQCRCQACVGPIIGRADRLPREMD